MSTVPEAITACHAGIRVLGLSLIANLGSGMAGHPLTHEDVMHTMNQVAPKLHFYLEKLMDLASETS
jgi:purine-nucleoside phosphorylase